MQRIYNCYYTWELKMLEDKYLERLGAMVNNVEDDITPLMMGKYIQSIYRILLNEQERDMREEKNK